MGFSHPAPFFKQVALLLLAYFSLPFHWLIITIPTHYPLVSGSLELVLQPAPAQWHCCLACFWQPDLIQWPSI